MPLFFCLTLIIIMSLIMSLICTSVSSPYYLQVFLSKFSPFHTLYHCWPSLNLRLYPCFCFQKRFKYPLSIFLAYSTSSPSLSLSLPVPPPPLVLSASGFLPPSFHQLLHSGATTFDCTQCPPGTFSNTSGEEFSEDKLKLSCAPTKQTLAYGHDLDH